MMMMIAIIITTWWVEILFKDWLKRVFSQGWGGDAGVECLLAK